MENYKNITAKQKEFYETKKKNLVTKIWYSLRNGILQKVRKNVGIEKEILQLHERWLGDLSNKKVLDLGCYEGNSLSLYLAKNSQEYIAIDLSEKGILHLSKRLKNISGARAEAVDFFSPDFKEDGFDLIYAYGVLHHFKDVDALIEKLNEKLTSAGQIISYDPLETSMPIKMLRKLYRPFQSDKEWEWPFNKKTFYKFEKAFFIKERRAVLGKAKWFFLLNLIPLPSQTKLSIANQWHIHDWENSLSSDRSMFSCMHLTMLMQKKS